ncbi:hypothetical protein [Pedobacter insulae]|uniref:ABC-2 family transporter protein n=1 Tax=Pedobacter insulae TaxID=414048 RepID=A0A1I2XTA3_9SPHI|nr:hypothetical protein [Pedobacter insulae]SFH16703.1 hypothetical protein SAMN04489864_10624 [Pedobacter insulae]
MRFSFTRFNHLFMKQLRENKKAYLLGLIALPILMGVVSLIMAYSGNFSEDNQSAVLVFGILIIGGFFCSTLLGDYALKPSAIRSLILPTTNLEKLFVAIVFGLIIFPVIYLALVYPVILLVNYIDFEVFGNLYLTDPITGKGLTGFIIGTTSILSFVLLCSLFYRKFIFIKASLTFVCLIFLLVASNSAIANKLIGDSQPTQFTKDFKKNMGTKVLKFELTGSSPFSRLEFSDGSFQPLYIVLDNTMGRLPFILALLIMPAMLLACFYRLREIEL